MGDTLSPLTFPPELYKRLVPSEFLSHHLKAVPSIRPDARAPKDFRDLAVTNGSLASTNGSAVVRLGGTVVTCGIRAEITEPDLFKPTTGFVVPNIELGPLCHSSFKAGPPSELQQSVAHFLMNTISTTGVLDLEKLCIQEQKAVWVLYVDVICISYEGSIRSASIAAIMAALLNTSLPTAAWDSDLENVICKHEYNPLSINFIPHVLEFGVFDGVVLADMTDEEESLCHEIVRFTLESSGKILSLSKSGGTTIGGHQLPEILSLCEDRAKLMDTIIRSNAKHRL